MVTAIRQIQGLELVMDDEWWTSESEDILERISSIERMVDAPGSLYLLLDYVNRHGLNVTFYPNGHILVKDPSTNIIGEDFRHSLANALRNFVMRRREA
jgi:hypothetical protein